MTQTFNASAVEILVFGHVIVVRVVEQSLRRYTADVETRSTERVVLLNTNCLLTRRIRHSLLLSVFV